MAEWSTRLYYSKKKRHIVIDAAICSIYIRKLLTLGLLMKSQVPADAPRSRTVRKPLNEIVQLILGCRSLFQLHRCEEIRTLHALRMLTHIVIPSARAQARVVATFCFTCLLCQTNDIAISIQHKSIRMWNTLYTDSIDKYIVSHSLPLASHIIRERFSIASLKNLAFVVTPRGRTRHTAAAHTTNRGFDTLHTGLRLRPESSRHLIHPTI